MDINLINKFGIDKEIVEEYMYKVKNQEKIIAVSGEFSAGKSTFINALINKKNFLPSANIECTPVLIDLVKDNGEYIEVKYNNGAIENKEATEENINKYARNVNEYDKSIVGITIPVKSEHLLDNYHLIDTPGTNTVHKEHELITKEILRKSDLVIYLLNKSVSDHDIEKINDIRKYTEDILFVISNMDEKVNDSYVNRSEENIDVFIEEATRVINEKLGIEAMILPVGSKAAYDDDKLISVIRESINDIASLNNQKRITENAKRQLAVIFEKRLEELKEEVFLNKSILEIDEDKLNKKITKLNKKISDIKLDEEALKNNYNNTLEVNKPRIKNELSKIYKQIEKEVLDKILSREEVEESCLNELFNEASENINKKVKNYLDNFINTLIKDVYLDNNLILENINTELDIKLVADLHEPTIEELDLTCDDDIIRLREERTIASSMIDEAMEEAAIEKNNLEEIKSEINLNKEKEDSINQELRAKGVYRPEYNEVHEEGGEQLGKTIGRVIGEVADVALIFINPAGGAATKGEKAIKTADKVKDGMKVTQYFAKSVQATKKGVSTASKVVKEAKKKSDSKLLKTLDLLSIGGIGEKVGGALGKKIKPSNVLYIEDEEKKAEWINENNLIKEEKNEIRKKQASLEYDLERGKTNLIQAMKKKRELEAELSLNEQKEQILLARKEKEYNTNSKMIIEKYYKDEISKVCTDEFEDTVIKVNHVIEGVIAEILIKSSNEFNNRLEVIEKSIDEIVSNRYEINSKLIEQDDLISELQEYKTWINEWL